jgi:predicted TIM-barrel enzyme
MPTFREVFPGKKPVFFIAIHVGLNPADAARDVDVAFNEGADGIFVIKDYHTLATDDDVLAAYRHARLKHTFKWIGINLLDHNATQALDSITDNMQGLWIDRAYVVRDANFLQNVRKIQMVLRPRTLLFPSVAFKYQEPVTDYAHVARLAAPHTDTIVTSGDATGVAADLNKVLVMRAATDLPLGLASGVSVDNIEDYLRIGVDFFIVNTSISDPAGRLDPLPVRALRKKIPQR